VLQAKFVARELGYVGCGIHDQRGAGVAQRIDWEGFRESTSDRKIKLTKAFDLLPFMFYL
jgi:hypothetical protein